MWRWLIKNVFDALPADGVFIVIENIIDNGRRQNTFGLLMSLNMLIENGDAFDYTMIYFEGWTKQAGLKKLNLCGLRGLPAQPLLINRYDSLTTKGKDARFR